MCIPKPKTEKNGFGLFMIKNQVLDKGYKND